MENTLHLNSKNLKKFKELYEDARATKQMFFIYQGQEVVTLFAKYVIELVESEQTKTINPNMN